MTLRAALRDQAVACTSLGSPFTARLLGLLADRLQPGTPLADRLFGWPGRIDSGGASVPLRLAGTLHGLGLSGESPALAALYPPNPPPCDDALWAEIDTAMRTHAPHIDAWLNRPPQTNELGRSAIMIAVGHWLTDHYKLPLVLSELGASAGLNLMWDRYALVLSDQTFGPADPALTLTPDWSGPLPPAGTPRIADRRGADLTPLNPHDPDDILRLTAYIWPDQAERLARTHAALAVAQAPVDRADAAEWLAGRLTQSTENHLRLIFHTVAWQYFPPDTQSRARALIEAAGARATNSAPLAWFGMEADGAGPGAALTLRLWPGNQTIPMGRADFHGRWVDWRPDAPI